MGLATAYYSHLHHWDSQDQATDVLLVFHLAFVFILPQQPKGHSLVFLDNSVSSGMICSEVISVINTLFLTEGAANTPINTSSLEGEISVYAEEEQVTIAHLGHEERITFHPRHIPFLISTLTSLQEQYSKT